MKEFECTSVINQGTHKQIVLECREDKSITRHEIFAPVSDETYTEGDKYQITTKKV